MGAGRGVWSAGRPLKGRFNRKNLWHRESDALIQIQFFSKLFRLREAVAVIAALKRCATQKLNAVVFNCFI
jgi:hypothetical protein